MLKFYFHPILGLQYNSDFTKPILQIGEIPEVSVKECIDLYRKMGIQFFNSNTKEPEGFILSNF